MSTPLSEPSSLLTLLEFLTLVLLHFLSEPVTLVFLFLSQFSSVAQSCLTLCDPIDYSTPGLPAHHQLPELTQTLVHQVGDAIQPSHPLSAPSPPTFNLAQHQGLFKWWPKYRSFSFSISPSNEYSGLISFRIDWFYLLAVQGTLKSLLQHHSSKVSILCLRWPNYWNFHFSISPSNEYSGLIFRMDWLDPLAV